MITSKRGIVIEAYSSGVTKIDDPGNELTWAEGLSFANAYPGGDMDAAFTIKRNIVSRWALKGAQRVVFRQGQRIVYEGYVSALDRLLDEQGQAIRVPLVGGWSHILMNRRWQKWWADNRIDESVWRVYTAASGAEKCTIDRNTRIRFTPKNVAWAQNEYAEVRFTMPTGDTVKRVTFDYDLQEGAQQWKLGLSPATFWSVSATGTGSVDHTLVSPTQTINLWFLADAAGQTPASDGTIYGQVTNMVVYSETGAIDPTQVTIDVIGKFTALNSSTAEVDSNTFSIVPFTADWETAADIITRAVAKGDASHNHWAAVLHNSETVASPDGKPVLGIEQYPALTDYDLAVRLDETNIAGAVQITQDFDAIANWIIVQYADENGWPVWKTPDDDATLTNATSAAPPPTGYGQRDYLLTLGYSTSTVAINNGVTFLTANKDPQWNSPPIPIWDYIRRKGNDTILPARIRAGQRLKVENFMTDLSGTGLTLLITGTRYDDESGINTLTFGQPLSPLMTILAPPPRLVDDVAGGGGDGGGGDGGAIVPGWGGPDRLNWKRKLGLKPGTKEWEAASKMSWKQKQAAIGTWKAKRKKKG